MTESRKKSYTPPLKPPNEEDQKVIDRILDSTKLKFQENGRQVLGNAIWKATWRFALHRRLKLTAITPWLDARRVRAAAAALDDAITPFNRAIDLLTDKRDLPSGELMAWAGSESDSIEQSCDRSGFGFKRASGAVDEMMWLRDQLQSWAKRTQQAAGSKGGRPSLMQARAEAVAILSPAYKQAFARRMGATRTGPAARLLKSFFDACGDKPHEDTIVKIILHNLK